MKRKILPVAVATVISGVAMGVQADTTVYGKINASFQAVDNADETGATIEDNWQLISNSSRLGLKGSQELDNGLEAIWKIELEYATDDGDVDGDEFKQRNTYIGVKGDFGKIKAGKFDTPLKKAQGKVNVFNDLYAGDIKNVMVGENRASDIVSYTSVENNGVKVTVAVIPGEDTGPTAEDDGIADGISGAISYKADDLFDLGLNSVKLSVAMDKDVAGADVIRLVAEAGYDAFTFGAIYQTAEEADSGTGFAQSGNAAATTAAGQISAEEQEGVMFSASYAMDELWTLKAQYGYSETDGADLVNVGGKGTVEVSQIAFGADYKLGKKTKAFGYYATIEGETNLAGLKTLEDTTFGVGLEHKF